MPKINEFLALRRYLDALFPLDTTELMSGLSFRTKTRGFTLTEIAIVLGIAGIVLAAIWAAGAAVSANSKVKTATSELAFILDGYKNMYSANGVDFSGDVTCVGVTAGYFPPPMVQGACTSLDFTSYPQHPWPDLSVPTYVSVRADSADQGIVIKFAGLPQGACVQYAAQVVNIPELLEEQINGVKKLFPPLGSDAPFAIGDLTTTCNKTSNSNNVVLMFKGR